MRFFRHGPSRLFFVLAVLAVVTGLISLGLMIVEGGGGAFDWLFGLIPSVLTFLLIAVILEYLARIADAVERPGFLGKAGEE